MGKRYGFLMRFTLSYDFTFLSLLNISLNSDNCDIIMKIKVLQIAISKKMTIVADCNLDVVIRLHSSGLTV